ncbi:MAG: PAS domain-containing sensor histidine kinase [Flavobacteriaceae bacterium]|nr:PAS domain-containing sensor histidine kinase [Flavobacteriaceae bacterium]
MITILIERKTGFLIASSDGTDVFSQTDDKKVFERVRASASHNKVIATAAEMLGKVAFGENQQTMGGAASILHSNENFVLSAESIGGENRPGWLVVSIMPRAAVSAPIEAQFFSLIGLIVTGCLLSVAVVFVFSRRVTKPLGALIETIDGQGDLQLLQFDKEAPRELEILRRSLISAENRASESMHIADMRLQRLNAIFKAAPDAILLVSASSVIQSANESAAKLLGHSMEALVGMSIEHLIPQRSQSTHQHHVERFLKNIESQTATMGDWRRVHCRTKSGKEIPILASLGRISNDPTSDTVVMIRDMSDAKVADDNLRQLSFELARELEAAKEADRAKSGFLAQMSHELRTPLNAIIGFSEAGKLEIFGEISPKIYRDYAGNIHRSGLHLLSLVNDILDFSKIDANKHDIELNIFDIRALLIETMKISQVIASENNVRLRCKNSRLFDKILADRRALHQCLLNLLSNAIRHSHENGTVLLRLISTAETLEFHVIDYGVGISPDNLKKIGKPFEQFENPMTSGRKGTGLGLAITKSLMELMRGRLEIESTEGVGTTAKLVFPKQPDSEFYNS